MKNISTPVICKHRIEPINKYVLYELSSQHAVVTNNECVLTKCLSQTVKKILSFTIYRLFLKVAKFKKTYLFEWLHKLNNYPPIFSSFVSSFFSTCCMCVSVLVVHK